MREHSLNLPGHPILLGPSTSWTNFCPAKPYAKCYIYRRPAVLPAPGGASAAPVRKKKRKGPKRIKKSVQDLDREMEEYIAGRDVPITAI